MILSREVDRPQTRVSNLRSHNFDYLGLGRLSTPYRYMSDRVDFGPSSRDMRCQGFLRFVRKQHRINRTAGGNRGVLNVHKGVPSELFEPDERKFRIVEQRTGRLHRQNNCIFGQIFVRPDRRSRIRLFPSSGKNVKARQPQSVPACCEDDQNNAKDPAYLR